MSKLNCVLLIDDDPITNSINERLFRKLQISERIEVKNNVDEAIEYLQKNIGNDNWKCPEIILVDIKMPGKNGFEFLERFTTMNIFNKESVKTFILSSSDDLDDLSQSFRYKLNGYIVKPLTERKILSLILEN